MCRIALVVVAGRFGLPVATIIAGVTAVGPRVCGVLRRWVVIGTLTPGTTIVVMFEMFAKI